MKRVLSILLAVVLLLSLIPAGAVEFSLTAAADTSGYYTYTVTNGEATITDVDTAISGDVVIPSTLGGYPVTKIDNYAFYDHDEITAVTIPEGVVSIGQSAFDECSALGSISIPASLREMGEGAFTCCFELTSVTIAEGVPYIGNTAFAACTALETVHIPDSVTRIDNSAFAICTALTSIWFSAEVTDIGQDAFMQCGSLADVYYVGSEADRADITIGSNNSSLTNATWHYTCNHANTTVSGYVAPTCTEDGYTGDTVCADCGETVTSGAVVPTRGYHNYCDIYEEETCTTPGRLTTACADCGDTIWSETIPAEHVPVTDAGKAPTCVKTGLTDGSHCERCGEVLVAQEVIPAGGMHENFRETSSATCTKDGYLTVYCADCDEVLDAGAWMYATGHNYGDDNICDTCGGEYYPEYYQGYYTYTVTDGKATVTDVNASINGDVVIPFTLGGYPVTSIGEYAFSRCISLVTVAIPAGVTSIGECAFSQCFSLTDVYYGGSEADRANIAIGSDDGTLLGATWHYNYVCPHVNTTVNGYVAPTCTEDGCTGDTVCTDCGETVTAGGTVIPATGHKVIGYALVNDTTYPFLLSADGTYCSTNKAHNSTATATLTVLQDGAIVIDYSTSTEKTYDKLTITQNSTVKVTASGTTAWTSVTIQAKAGDKIYIKYAKDGSVSNGDDTVYFKMHGKPEGWEPTCEDVVTCTVCGVTVKEATEHVYEKACDTDCNVCGKTRITEHRYEADDDTCVECGASRYAYTVTDGNATITDVDTAISGDVVIPSALGGYPVTRIGDYAFAGCSSLKSVEIPDSVTSIGAYAFSGCTAFTTVTVPDSVTVIEVGAFEGCASLECITVPFVGRDRYVGEDKRGEYGPSGEYDNYDDVLGYIFGYTMIESYYGGSAPAGTVYQYSFSGTHMTPRYYYYHIPNSLRSVTVTSAKTIFSSAFRNCAMLTSVTIGESVTSIGAGAFSDTAYYNDAANWENGVLYIGNHLIKAENSLAGSYNVRPGTKTIGNSAFEGCTLLASITISDGMTSIGEYAFDNCTSLASITMPDSVTSIEEFAFSDCTSLQSVSIPDSVTSIGGSAFYHCDALTDVYYDGSEVDRANISIGDRNDALTNATWHYSCKHRNTTCGNVVDVTCTEDGYTGDTVCADCGETVAAGTVIPATGHDYGDDNFCDVCGEDSVRVYYTATVTDGKLTITDVDTAIGGKISIPSVIDGCPVVAIGKDAFRDCKNITAITIPESITSIGNYAFRDCTALTTVYYNAANCTSVGVNAYPAFHGCTALTTAYIGKTVEVVAPRLFRGVTTLTAVYMTKNTREVATNAFYQCEALADVYFVGTAGEWATVSVKSNNAPLANAAVSYNAPCFDGHEWTGDCDDLCEFCGTTRVTVHGNIVDDAALEPTCTATGLTAGSHCAVCGNVIQKQNVIPALGHVWDEGTVTVEPTYEACGYRRVTCTVCGATELLEIPSLTRAEVRDGYYYYDGVKVPNAGLVKIHNDYYYVLAGAKVKTGRYSVFNTNGLDIPSGIYYFFEDGRMNLAAGVYEGRYYNAQGLSEAYAGLVEVNGAKYYIQAGGNVTTGRYFISKLNDLLPKKRAYTFYPDGRMLEDTRIYEDGFYYENGLRTPYAGLVVFEGDFYYVGDSGKYVTGKMQIVANPNNTGKQKNGRYYFDENGKMLCGVIREGRYFGADGLAPYAVGVVAVDGKLYYVGGTHGALRKSATVTISAAKTNGLCAAGKYTADADGVLTPAA